MNPLTLNAAEGMSRVETCETVQPRAQGMGNLELGGGCEDSAPSRTSSICLYEYALFFLWISCASKVKTN